jgi:hypothetical protein
MILKSPGMNAETLWKIQNSPRALIADKFYRTATGIKNRAGAFVGFALTGAQLDELLLFREVKGRELARDFWKRYSQDTEAVEVGRFILVGVEVDMFFDLLAGIAVVPYTKPGEIITPFNKISAEEINKKEEGRRW